jgi:mRNA interferase HigB
MRVIAIRTLREFWQQKKHADSEQPLKSWYEIASKADWATPADIKAQFGHASIIGNNRVVFNIAGNKYRLIAAVNYDYRIMYVRFVGTHKQYDEINAEEI